MAQCRNSLVNRMLGNDRFAPDAVEQIIQLHDLPSPLGEEHEKSHRSQVELFDRVLARDLAKLGAYPPGANLPMLVTIVAQPLRSPVPTPGTFAFNTTLNIVLDLLQDFLS